MPARAVFLDRDGTMNLSVQRGDVPYGSPRSLDELVFPSDADAALARLRQAGFLLIGVTNQPEVPRGQVSRAAVEDVNAAVAKRFGLAAIYTCWHDDADNCACRKPKPGLLLDAAAACGIALEASYLIGDRCKDVEAAQAAGATALLVDQGYAGACQPAVRVSSLTEAADWILSR